MRLNFSCVALSGKTSLLQKFGLPNPIVQVRIAIVFAMKVTMTQANDRPQAVTSV